MQVWVRVRAHVGVGVRVHVRRLIRAEAVEREPCPRRREPVQLLQFGCPPLALHATAVCHAVPCLSHGVPALAVRCKQRQAAADSGRQRQRFALVPREAAA